MKKVVISLFCMLLLGLSFSAAADGNDTQLYELSVHPDNTVVFTIKNSPAFWEYPTCKAGEYVEKAGKLTLHNTAATEQMVALQTVVFPYDNAAALQYLNHLFITVKSGETVLYNGPYSGINEKGAISMSCVLPADSSVSYDISLRSDYTYSGDGLAADELIEWKFAAGEQAMKEDTPLISDESLTNQPLSQIIMALAITAILAAIAFVLDFVLRSR